MKNNLIVLKESLKESSPKKKLAHETGHAHNVGNFERIISACKEYDKKYNPSIEKLSLSNLETLHKQAQASMLKLIDAKNAKQLAAGELRNSLKPLKSLSTKIINALSISGVSPEALQNAKSIHLKIQGQRAKKAEDTKKVGGVLMEKKIHSVSQQSQVSLIDHFTKLIHLLQELPSYKPNESDLQVSTLQAQLQTLTEQNSKSIAADNQYTTARLARNTTLYEEGLVQAAKDVKQYVKSIFGASSEEYKRIGALRFESPSL